jgi:outer membrane protein assembly factor BamB
MVVIASDRGCGPDGGYVYAFDQKTGKLRWKFKASGPSTGFAEIDGAIAFGTREDEWLSLDLRTGKLNWKFREASPDPQCEVRSGPATDGVKVYLATHDAMIYALDPKDGRVVWKHASASAITTGLGVYKDVLYYGTADNHFYGLDPDGKLHSDLALPATAEGNFGWGKVGEGEMDSLFAVHGEEKNRRGMVLGLRDEFEKITWSTEADREWTSDQPHVWKGLVIAGNCKGEIVAYQAATGKVQWRDQVKGCVRSFGHDPTTLYIGVQEGTVYAYRPAR